MTAKAVPSSRLPGTFLPLTRHLQLASVAGDPDRSPLMRAGMPALPMALPVKRGSLTH